MSDDARRPQLEHGRTLDTVCNDQPKAWVFYEDESRTKVRFVLTDPARVQAWASAHQGPIVPLYEKQTDCKESGGQA